MDNLPKVGDWVVRNKYPSKFLEADKAYQVIHVVADGSYTSDWKIALSGIELHPSGAHRWFDPAFFVIVSMGWVPGTKVKCINPESNTMWPADAAKLGGMYTIKSVTGIHLMLEETTFLYKKSDFELLNGEGWVPPPKPKVVIYNQQVS